MPLLSIDELLNRLHRLNEIGIALSAERDSFLLLEKILSNAQGLTQADGGSIYTLTDDKRVRFEMVANKSLNLLAKEKDKYPFLQEEFPLFIEGLPNNSHIVAYAVNHKKTVNVQNAYEEMGFDFSGTKQFDQKTGYKTISVLTVPILNHESRVIGALQLINALDPTTKKVLPFTQDDQHLTESLASQAGVALTNQRLILDLRLLFDSFVRVISAAIDAKSPSTGNHSKRVPIVALMLAKAVDATTSGPFQKVHFTEDELKELEIAALLHDCGKITTPSHIVEKSTKLETLFDRITLLQTRFEIEKRDKKIALLEQKLAWLEKNGRFSKEECQQAFQQLEEVWVKENGATVADLKFVQSCNQGSPIMDEQKAARLKKIGERLVEIGDKLQPLLSAEEIEKLSIVSGTLTAKERKIMENHVVLTQRMLSQLIYPKELKNIPAIASAHHEWVNGQGYPHGLTKEEMSLQARILTIADVFEALSAPDRPYKLPLPVSEVYAIMQRDCERGHLDPELFTLFRQAEIGEKYGRLYLTPEQLV